MNRRLKGLLCFVLAITFAANTLWLFPHADQPRYEYRAVELNESTDSYEIASAPLVFDCRGVESRTCAFETSTIRTNTTSDRSQYTSAVGYSYLLYRDGFRDPTAKPVRGGYVLSSKPVSKMAVVANLSVRLETTTYPEIESAVRNGNSFSRHKLFEYYYVVNDSGTYYGIDLQRNDPWFAGVNWFPLRGFLWLATVPLSVASFVYWYG